MGGFVGAYHVAASGAIGPQFAVLQAQGVTGKQYGYVTLVGWTARETGGSSSVTITIHDSGASTGNIVAEIEIPSGTSAPPANFGPEGIKVPVGCYVSVGGSGTLSGVLYIR